MPLTYLIDRAVIRVSGPEARTFLQGLVTCDMMQITPLQPAYGALLTPQGKIRSDFFIIEHPLEGFYIDLPSTQADDIFRALTLYKLRAQIEISSLPDWRVLAGWANIPAWPTELA